MSRQYIDCREFPSESKCSVTIMADTEKELMEAAVQHACTVHGHADTPAFRAQLKEAIHVGTAPD